MIKEYSSGEMMAQQVVRIGEMLRVGFVIIGEIQVLKWQGSGEMVEQQVAGNGEIRRL
jgi:hypothetical protein